MDTATAVIAIVPVILIVAIVIYVVRGTMDNNSDKIKTILGATVGIVLVCCIAIPIISGLNETEPEPAPTPQSLIVTVNTSVELNAGESYTFTPTANVSGVSYTLTGSGVTINGLTITGEIPGTYSLNLKAVKVGYTESNTAISVSVVAIGKTFILPASVTDTEDTPAAFYGSNLTSIEVETGNTVYSSVDGCLYSLDGTTLYAVPGGYSGIFTIPASVTDFEYYVLAYCPNITSIQVETGNTEYSSVDGCLYSADGTILYKVPNGYNNTAFTIPASVSVQGDPFEGCTNIASIEVETGNTEYSSVDGCLYSADGTILHKVPEGWNNTILVLPADVVGVGNYSGSFEDGRIGGPNITSIEVETGNTAFSSIDGCLYFGETLVYIPAEYANTVFTVPASCTVSNYLKFSNITSIEVETENADDYSSIDGCLYNADGTTLLKVPGGYSGILTISASVTYIDVFLAFNGCFDLESIEVETENADYSSIDGCLYNADGTTLLKVPNGY